MRAINKGAPRSSRWLVPAVVAAVCWPLPALSQCVEEPVLKNYTGASSVACPCFTVNEQAGAILDAPVSHYPIEIRKIRVGWGSQFGGMPDQLEQALNIYPTGLPIPGSAQFSLLGPVLIDGVINEFDISAFDLGNRVILSGPFMVTLEFLNQSAGDVFAPSVIHDGNGCQVGKNSVFTNPGGWADACPLGVTGNWVMEVVYCRVQLIFKDSFESDN